jgi:hypothetical protein
MVARNRERQLAKIVKIYLNTINTIIKHFSNSAFFLFLRKRIDEVHPKKSFAAGKNLFCQVYLRGELRVCV